MPRKRSAAVRKILPDAVYSNLTLAKFTNHLMLSGKKSVAEKLVYEALNIAVERNAKSAHAQKSESTDGGEGGSGTSSTKLTPVQLLEKVLDNVRPTVEVRSRRVGGATYQVPVEVRQNRRDTLAMRWIIIAARARGEKGMVLRLAGEFLDALNGRGAAVKKREDTHKMAKANQAFAHFRWN
ncbi:MAG: 30S ribosomal protein S7 [Gammaproteobacteria bacterium]